MRGRSKKFKFALGLHCLLRTLREKLCLVKTNEPWGLLELVRLSSTLPLQNLLLVEVEERLLLGERRVLRPRHTRLTVCLVKILLRLDTP